MTWWQFRPAATRLHYAWIIVAVTFAVVVVTAGVRATPGVLIVPLEQEFHWSRATISFAVLPGSGAETFAAFSLVIGICLVPIGALLARARQPWQIGMFTAMTMTFMPLLAPTNQMV